jgi:hypothetical protein
MRTQSMLNEPLLPLVGVSLNQRVLPFHSFSPDMSKVYSVNLPPFTLYARLALVPNKRQFFQYCNRLPIELLWKFAWLDKKLSGLFGATQKRCG